MFDEAENQSELVAGYTESRRSWERIRESRFQLADELERTAEDLHFDLGSSLRRVAFWLRGSADYKEALAQPMVLAMCLELRKSDRQADVNAGHFRPGPNIEHVKGTLPEPATTSLVATTPFTPTELQQAIRAGVRQSIGRRKATRWRLFGLLMYPLLILLFGWIFWVGTSFIIFPSIEDIFRGFGISLPKITELLLTSSSFVRQSGGLLILIPIAYVALFLGLNYYSTRLRTVDGSWLDQKLTGKRGAIAQWSWHLSLLLEWGLSTKSAIMVAGMCSNRGWLQQYCQDWIGEPRNFLRPTPTPSGATSKQSTREFIPKSRFQLVNCAMELDGIERILLLREVSTYYQEKSSGFVEWIVVWISSLLVWLAFGMVILILIAVYAPLLQLMRIF